MRIVAGEWRGRRITTAAGRDTRPTADRVREAWMSAIATELPGSRVLDLFAGSGALGLEALSRGAEHATFVESAAAPLRALERNLRDLEVPADRALVVRGDAERFAAAAAPGEYDVAFADPPYGAGFAPRLAAVFRERPFARILCIEHGRDEPIEEGDDARSRRYGDTWLTFLHRLDDG